MRTKWMSEHLIILLYFVQSIVPWEAFFARKEVQGGVALMLDNMKDIQSKELDKGVSCNYNKDIEMITDQDK